MLTLDSYFKGYTLKLEQLSLAGYQLTLRERQSPTSFSFQLMASG